MSDFDVAAAIVEFIGEPSRTTLELPHMTTGQRKKTKVLLDAYSELRCESFGFGAERRLHVFKVEADLLEEKIQSHTKTCIEQAPSKVDNSDALVYQDAKLRTGSPDCSTNASTDVSEVSCSSNASPRSNSQDKEAESLHFVNVRNTFIHVEPVSMDERTVQSMPHGMFGKCMLAEMSQKCRTDVARTIEEKAVSYEAPREHVMAFSVGAAVVVEGLVKAPMFNGLTAVVEGWDEASGRYKILIGSTGFHGGSQQAMVKEENLKLVSPCP